MNSLQSNLPRFSLCTINEFDYSIGYVFGHICVLYAKVPQNTLQSIISSVISMCVTYLYHDSSP